MDTGPNATVELAARTRVRNQSVWAGMLGGTLLESDELVLTGLFHNYGETYMAVTDELLAVKEYERDTTHQLQMDQVDQERLFAQMKADTERAKLAIRMALDDYIYAEGLYEVAIKNLLMAAEEYAAAQEVENLHLKALGIELDVEKEGIRGQELEAKIQEEAVNQAMVQADIARQQLEVARANVQAIMAGIEAQEAEIKIIDTELAIAMADVEMATLKADIAQILAEIVLKGLSKIELAWKTQEIEQAYAFAASKLADALALWTVKDRIEEQKIMNIDQLLVEAARLFSFELAAEDLQITAVLNDTDVQAYEGVQTEAEILNERAVKRLVVGAKEGLQGQEAESRMLLSNWRLWQTLLMNAAQQWVYMNTNTTTFNNIQQSQAISKRTGSLPFYVYIGGPMVLLPSAKPGPVPLPPATPMP